MGDIGRGHLFILLIEVSNLGAAKSVASCKATEPGKYVTCKNIELVLLRVLIYCWLTVM